MKLIMHRYNIIKQIILEQLHNYTKNIKCRDLDFAIILELEAMGEEDSFSPKFKRYKKLHCYCFVCLGSAFYRVGGRLNFSTKDFFGLLYLYLLIYYYMYPKLWFVRTFSNFKVAKLIFIKNILTTLLLEFNQQGEIWRQIRNKKSQLISWAHVLRKLYWAAAVKSITSAIGNLKKYLPMVLLTYKTLKSIVLASLLAILIIVMLVISLKIYFLRHIACWIIFGNIFFWLFSGFTFFLKRGRFGKFTSALQRFWKRAFVSFWVIEGFLFCLFFYYYLNSSQEPLFMYDSANLANDFLLNLPSGFSSMVLLSVVIVSCQGLLLALSFKRWTQTIIFLSLSSFSIFYVFYLETYQIIYALGNFNDINWVYDSEENTWSIETESIKLRIKHYYFLMCLIAKYWHFVFIFFSWVFFLLRSLESGKVTYQLLSFNYQNILILYVLNLLCYCNWLKFMTRRFFDQPYYWFFSDIDKKHLKLLISEFFLLLSCLFIPDTTNINLTDVTSLVFNWWPHGITAIITQNLY